MPWARWIRASVALRFATRPRSDMASLRETIRASCSRCRVNSTSGRVKASRRTGASQDSKVGTCRATGSPAILPRVTAIAPQAQASPRAETAAVGRRLGPTSGPAVQTAHRARPKMPSSKTFSSSTRRSSEWRSAGKLQPVSKSAIGSQDGLSGPGAALW